ncbi:transcriptional regulator, GntR family [Clostridium sp. ATCC 29733]|nr:transcriptional regulator, GntR family [Clostridium sp. ATCC 29733]
MVQWAERSGDMWKIESDRPIYLQLVETLQQQILTGVYPPGGKLPSVRDLAAEAAVNPNTMQKALGELERLGLVYAQRTAGRFITDDRERLEQMKEQLAAEQVQIFLKKMSEMGLSRQDVIALLERAEKEME